MSEAPWKFVAASPARRHALELARRVTGADCAVLILGPTGVGKDVLAGDLHAHGPRAGQPFVAVNCAAIAPSLFESELFGHARGAYTSATGPKVGLVEVADGGTLFLDEVGELSLEAQSKLLRFLDKGTFWPVGATRERAADVRVIAATNRDLPSLIGPGGGFRADLYFRLSVVTIHLAPLQPDDVRLLARELAGAAAAHARVEVEAREVEALEALAAARAWPGGGRELRNAIERCLLLRRPGEAVDHAWHAVGADVPPVEVADVAGLSAGQILDALDDLLFLSVAREAGDVRELAQRLDRSQQAIYDRLRRLSLRPRDLGDVITIQRALARPRAVLLPYLPRLQELLKS